jgi:hypothetical protein
MEREFCQRAFTGQTGIGHRGVALWRPSAAARRWRRCIQTLPRRPVYFAIERYRSETAKLIERSSGVVDQQRSDAPKFDSLPPS